MRALRPIVSAFIVGAALAFTATPAWSANPEAVKKFEEGRKLRAEGNCQGAVQPFLDSIAAEPTIGAHYNLGYCYEQLKQAEPAYDHYKKALKLAGEKKDAREEEIRESFLRAREVVHWVRLDVPPKVQKTAGVKITVDGEVVPPAEYPSEAILRKAARHEVVVSVPGRKDWVAANQPDHNTVVVDMGEPLGEAKPPPPPTSTAEPASDGSGQRLAGLIVMGVGAAGLITAGALGIYFLAANPSKEDTGRGDFNTCFSNATSSHPPSSQEIADANRECADAGRTKEWIDWRKNTGLAGGISAVAGVVLLGGGLFLYLTAGSSKEAPAGDHSRSTLRIVPQATPTGSGLSVLGTF